MDFLEFKTKLRKMLKKPQGHYWFVPGNIIEND
jgi:hypothetical protein